MFVFNREAPGNKKPRVPIDDVGGMKDPNMKPCLGYARAPESLSSLCSQVDLAFPFL